MYSQCWGNCNQECSLGSHYKSIRECGRLQKVYLDGRRSKVKKEETNLGNFSADANLWYANEFSEKPVHLSLKNGGGMRTGIGSAQIPLGVTDYSNAVFAPPL